MVIVVIGLALLGMLMVCSLAKAAGDADRKWEQLMLESQSKIGGDSSAG